MLEGLVDANQRLERLCDVTFRIEPEITPELALGGRLRRLVHCWMASQLRYFGVNSARFGVKQSTSFVNHALVTAVIKVGLASSEPGDAVGWIKEQGRFVRLAFERDNMRLTSMAGGRGSFESLGEHVKELSETNTTLIQLMQFQAHEMADLKASVAVLRQESAANAASVATADSSPAAAPAAHSACIVTAGSSSSRSSSSSSIGGGRSSIGGSSSSTSGSSSSIGGTLRSMADVVKDNVLATDCLVVNLDCTVAEVMSSIVSKNISIDQASSTKDLTNLNGNCRTGLKAAKSLMMAVMSKDEAVAFEKAMRPNQVPGQSSFLVMALKFQERLAMRLENEEILLFNKASGAPTFTLNSFIRRRSMLMKKNGGLEFKMMSSSQDERDALDAAIAAKKSAKKTGKGRKRKAVSLGAPKDTPEDGGEGGAEDKTRGLVEFLGFIRSKIGTGSGGGGSSCSSGT